MYSNHIIQTVQKLLDVLQQNYPKANDEDVVKILNMAGKSYDKAINFV